MYGPVANNTYNIWHFNTPSGQRGNRQGESEKPKKCDWMLKNVDKS